MRRERAVTIGLGLCLGLVSTAAATVPVAGQTWETTLQGRDLDGNAATFEAFYDTFLDVSWLADVNYVMTSEYDADGLMTWEEANTWATNLDVFGVTGWRLPSEAPLDGVAFDGNVLSTDGSTDFGYADGVGWVDPLGNPLSELAYMYHVALGNLAECAFGESVTCDEGASRPGTGLTNTGPFSNLNAVSYWGGATFDYFGSVQGVYFDFAVGNRVYVPTSVPLSAWAVRSGDIGPAVTVPEPGTHALLMTGLLGLFLVRRRNALRAKREAA